MTVLEILYVETDSFGTGIKMSKMPKKFFAAMYGAKTGKTQRELYFPCFYSLEQIIEQMEKWPRKQNVVIKYDNAYIVRPFHLKYEENNYPHNWKKLKGVKHRLPIGILFETKMDLTLRTRTKNLDKLNRRLLGHLFVEKKKPVQ